MALPDKTTILDAYGDRGLPFSNVLANTLTQNIGYRGLPFFSTSGGGVVVPPEPPVIVYQPQVMICM